MQNEFQLIHITDLFNPPGDPDDHFDLLSLLSIWGLPVTAVVIDHTVEHGVPGLPTVAKAAALCGRAAIPCAAGLERPLSSESDTGDDQPAEQQAAIELILSTLERCPDRRMIFTIVGSLRDLAAAYNRNPKLFHAKTARIMLNAGDSSGLVGTKDWNTNLDVASWRRILSSGLHIDWFPCNPSKGRGEKNTHTTWWGFRQKEFLAQCPATVRQFFDSEGIQSGDPVWRHMWSTVSLWEAARLVGCEGIPVPNSYEMLPISLKLGEDGTALWALEANDISTSARIFSIKDSAAYEEEVQKFLEDHFGRIGQ